MADTTLYREFVLTSPSVWSALAAFIKANAQAAIDQGSPLRIIVTAEQRQRNVQQNRFYFGVVLKAISEQAWVNGSRFNKDVWHEYFSRKFGVLEDMTLPDGEIITTRQSTTRMSVGDFSTYLDEVQAHAASEMGVIFSDPVGVQASRARSRKHASALEANGARKRIQA